MNRAKLEKVTASLVVVFITVLTLGFILVITNAIFEWDIFSPFTEKIIYFCAFCMLVVTIASTLVNIMLNLSRLAYFGEIIAHHLVDKKDK